MALRVVEEASEINAGAGEGTVVVESNNQRKFSQAIEELGLMEARQLALSYAAQMGLGSAGIGAASAPYPVNSKGSPCETAVDETTGEPLPAAHPLKQPAHYRCEIKIKRGMR